MQLSKKTDYESPNPMEEKEEEWEEEEEAG